jgi:hypothetical protein
MADMNPEVQDLIRHSSNQYVLRALVQGQPAQVVALIDARVPAAEAGLLGRAWHQLRRGTFRPTEGAQALRVLRAALQGGPGSLPPPSADLSLEVAELGRAVQVAELAQNFPLANRLAAVLLSWLQAGADGLAGSNYPRQSMNALSWMEGAGLAAWAGVLARYFAGRQHLSQEYEAHLSKTRLTLAVMGHYPHIVGPTIIELGRCLEQLGRGPEAAARYHAVVADFEELLDELPELNTMAAEEPDVDFSETRRSLQALREAYAGLLRTDPTTDTALLQSHLNALDHTLPACRPRRPAPNPSTSLLPPL